MLLFTILPWSAVCVGDYNDSMWNLFKCIYFLYFKNSIYYRQETIVLSNGLSFYNRLPASFAFLISHLPSSAIDPVIARANPFCDNE